MITLLHPSRGRPDMAFETYLKWKDKARGNFEYILGIDESDVMKERYKGLYWGKDVLIHEGKNKSLVECTNNIAEIAHGDILIYLSDDFDCPDNWDLLIENKVKGKDKFLLKVNDCLQPFNNTVLTIPIMSKSLYNELGFFWHPDYLSQWVDVDLYYRCEEYLVFEKDLNFPHLHYSNGKATHDETYRRNESNWAQGLEVLNRELKKMGRSERFDKQGSKIFDTRK